jgi:hypothetical protein
MKKIYITLLTVLFSFSGYSQVSISNTSNGIVTLTYNDSANGWALYDPLSEPTIYVYIWIEPAMNSTSTLYRDEWSNSGSFFTINWDGSDYSGTLDLNTHNFLNSGGVFPTGTVVTDFNFILRNNNGTRQSADLLASNYGFTNATLPVNDYLNSLFSLNLLENTIQIEGLEYNQKFRLDVYDLSGKLVKKIDEKSNLTIHELTPSVYILKLTIEDKGSISKKVIKK